MGRRQMQGLGTALQTIGNAWMQFAIQKGLMSEELAGKKDLIEMEDRLATARDARLEQLKIAAEGRAIQQGKDLKDYEIGKEKGLKLDPELRAAAKQDLDAASARELATNDAKIKAEYGAKSKFYKENADVLGRGRGAESVTPETFDVEVPGGPGEEPRKEKHVWVRAPNGAATSIPLAEYNKRMQRGPAAAPAEAATGPALPAAGGLAAAATGGDWSSMSEKQMAKLGAPAIEDALDSGAIWRDEDKAKASNVLKRYFPTPEDEAGRSPLQLPSDYLYRTEVGQ